MATHFRTCKVLSQLVQNQTSRVLMINRGRMFLSTSAAKRGGGYSNYNDNHGGELEDLPIKTKIGTREVVGYGMNGEEIYIDNVHYPFPSIRFKEDTPQIIKLKEKEKGDWKKMTVAEKKELYRASFCQTLVEAKAPTGDWKAVVGISLCLISLGIWGYVWLAAYGKLFISRASNCQSILDIHTDELLFPDYTTTIINFSLRPTASHDDR